MSYSLWGHELNEEISPLEAGLNPFIDWNKDFLGKGALLQQREVGIRRKIGYFISENRRSPRPELKLVDARAQDIGFVTSGTFSPSLERGIGIGMFDGAAPKVGDKIFFGSDDNIFSAVVTARPFYKNGSLKK